MTHDDHKYIVALLNNDSELVNEIYSKCWAKVRSFIMNNSGTQDEARDVFHDSLYLLFHKARVENFQLTCPIEGYMMMLSRAIWFNILKSSQRKKETIQDPSLYSNVSNTSEELDIIEFKDKIKFLEEKFEELGKGCSELLRLSWKGMSMRDIADRLGISYTYVRKKKSVCTKELKEIVKRDPKFKKYMKR